MPAGRLCRLRGCLLREQEEEEDVPVRWQLVLRAIEALVDFFVEGAFECGRCHWFIGFGRRGRLEEFVDAGQAESVAAWKMLWQIGFLIVVFEAN